MRKFQPVENSKNSEGSIDEKELTERPRTNSSLYPRVQLKAQNSLTEESTGNFFTNLFVRFERLIGEKSKYINLIEINKILDETRKNIEKSDSAKKIEATFHKKIQKIKEKRFYWEIDHKKITMITPIFKLIDVFNDWSHFLFIDCNPLLPGLLNWNFFDPFLQVEYFLGDERHDFADSINEFHCSVIWAFIKLYVSFPCGDFPSIEDHQNSLSDPFSRQKIRERNQAKYENKIESVYHFSLLQQIIRKIEFFVLLQPLKWSLVPNHNTVTPLLHLIHQALSYGLIKHSDCEVLMIHLQHMSEVMIHLESALRNENKHTLNKKNHVLIKTSSLKNKKMSFHELIECRVLVSKIIIHIICVWSDFHFQAVCKKNRLSSWLRFNDPLKVMIYNSESLHKNICLVYLRYLSSRTLETNYKFLTDDLLANNNLILVFLTNYENNFFVNSLTLMDPKLIDEYLIHNPEKSNSQTEIIRYKVEDFINLIKVGINDSKLDRIITYFMEMSNLLKTELSSNKKLGANLEFSWSGFTRLYFLNFVKLQSETDNFEIIDTGFECLRLLMQNNRHAQSMIFGGVCFTSYKQLFLKNYAKTMKFILDIFKNDFLIFNISDEVFDLKMELYDEILKKFDKLKHKTEIEDDDRFLIDTVKNFNIFFTKILMENSERKNYSQKYDLVIQFKIIDTITDFVFLRFTNKDNNDQMKSIDLTKINKFYIPASAQYKIVKYQDDFSFQVAVIETLYTFLRLFNIATSNIYPRIVHKKIEKSMEFYDISSIDYEFGTGLMVRTQILILVKNMRIFSNNHIIYEEFNNKGNMNLERLFIPNNIQEIKTFLTTELTWWFKNGKLLVKLEKENELEMMKAYIFEGLLPSIYKFFTGVQNLITILEEELIIKDLYEISNLLRGILDNRLEIIFKIARCKFSTENHMKKTFEISHFVSVIEASNQHPLEGKKQYNDDDAICRKDTEKELLQEIGNKKDEKIENDDREKERSKHTNNELDSDQIQDSKGKALKIIQNDKSFLISHLEGPKKKTANFDLESSGKNDKSSIEASKIEREFYEKINQLRNERNPNFNKKNASDIQNKREILSGHRRGAKVIYQEVQPLSKTEEIRHSTNIEDSQKTNNSNIHSKSGQIKNRNQNIDRKEELCDTRFQDIRDNGSRIIKEIKLLYDHQLKYKEFITIFDYFELDKKKPTEIGRHKLEERKGKDIINKKKNENIVDFIVRIYKQTFYETHPDKNPLIRLLTLDNHRERYNSELAYVCITVLANMTAVCNSDNYKRCFFIKSMYLDQISAVNTLMSYSPNLRIQLHKILDEAYNLKNQPWMWNEVGTCISSAFVQNIWSISIYLTLYLFYKPFEDLFYEKYLEQNRLISRFFKNFFMNNFSDLKKFLSENDFGVLSLNRRHKIGKNMIGFNQISEKELEFKKRHSIINTEITVFDKKSSVRRMKAANSNSIFFENFTLLTTLFSKCNTWRQQGRNIMPSDRPNLYDVLVQILTNITEYVIGPSLNNQLLVFNQSALIWNGIINRIVDDIDSDFYKVKLATLIYLNGLLQGLNQEIVDFMSHQLRVQVFYESILELIRKLYTKFIMENNQQKENTETLNYEDELQRKRKHKFANYNQENHFESLKKEKNKFSIIKNPNQILSLYKLNSKFNSHQIIEIIISTYILMRSLSDKIKFWYLFIKDKENGAKKYTQTEFNNEDNVIFNFVLSIIFSVEIVYVISEKIIENDDISVSNYTKVNILNEKSSMNNPIGDQSMNDSRNLFGIQFRDESGFGLNLETFKNEHKPIHRKNNEEETKQLNESVSLQSLKRDTLGNSIRASDRISENESVKKRNNRVKRQTVQHRMFFQTPPVCFFITDGLKEQMMETMPIRNKTRKHLHIYKNLYYTINKAEKHQKRVYRVGWLANLITSKAFAYYEILITLVAALMNLLMISFLKNNELLEGASSLQVSNEINIIVSLGYIMIGLSTLILSLWLYFEWLDNADSTARRERIEKERSLSNTELFKIYFLKNLIFDGTFNSFLLSFIITILGVKVNLWFYTWNILLFVKIYKAMSDILGAIVDNYLNMLSTFSLLVLILYLYAFIIMIGLDDTIFTSYSGPQNCRTLFDCLLNTVNLGLRASGGVGPMFVLIDDPNKPRFWLMWFVSISHFVIIKLGVLNMVAGVIVEGFGHLREKRNNREMDKKNFCIVCGMDRWESEKQGLNFEEHINEVHNTWHYFYFLVRLKLMKKSDFSVVEFEVFNQYELGQTDWFPKKRFLTDENGYVELNDGFEKANEIDKKSDEEDEDEEMVE